MRKIYLFLLLIMGVVAGAMAQSGCPGCEITLPDLPADTIYLSDAPDGNQGVYYDGDISFRLPQTTTPVSAEDPSIPSGLPISSIEILSVSSLPPGLSWQTNQSEYSPDEEADGCVKLCGIPLQSGLFEVQVVVSAQVLFITQETSFSFPLYIAPAVTTTDGFALSNYIGCGEVTTSFENNVPSGGSEGFAYQWDFGNGATSTLENPPNQTYSTPGEYIVEYQAIVDTAPYYLTNVILQSANCSDLLDGPDIKMTVSYPDGTHYHTTAHVQNASFPVSFDVLLPIGDEGDYQLNFVDLDSGLGGADDDCGSIVFNQNSNGSYSNSNIELSLTIVHQIDTIQSSDTIFVYEVPSVEELSYNDEEPWCKGDTVLLVSAPFDGIIRWYKDSLLMANASTQVLGVTQNGFYYVEWETAEGCSATSAIVDIDFANNPDSIWFVNNNNLLTLDNPNDLPDEYILTWSLDGEILGEEEQYCIQEDGLHILTITDLASGCEVSYAEAVEYNPENEDCLTSVDDISLGTLRIWPNPTASTVWIQSEETTTKHLRMTLVNSNGNIVLERNLYDTANTQKIDMSLFANGVYVLHIYSDNTVSSTKIVKI